MESKNYPYLLKYVESKNYPYLLSKNNCLKNSLRPGYGGVKIDYFLRGYFWKIMFFHEIVLYLLFFFFFF